MDFKNKYMHLINGKPGYFDGFQVCFSGDGLSFCGMFRGSLRHIKREQALSIQNRKKAGFDYNSNDYSYLRIRMD